MSRCSPAARTAPSRSRPAASTRSARCAERLHGRAVVRHLARRRSAPRTLRRRDLAHARPHRRDAARHHGHRRRVRRPGDRRRRPRPRPPDARAAPRRPRPPPTPAAPPPHPRPRAASIGATDARPASRRSPGASRRRSALRPQPVANGADRRPPPPTPRPRPRVAVTPRPDGAIEIARDVVMVGVPATYAPTARASRSPLAPRTARAAPTSTSGTQRDGRRASPPTTVGVRGLGGRTTAGQPGRGRGADTTRLDSTTGDGRATRPRAWLPTLSPDGRRAVWWDGTVAPPTTADLGAGRRRLVVGRGRDAGAMSRRSDGRIGAGRSAGTPPATRRGVDRAERSRAGRLSLYRSTRRPAALPREAAARGQAGPRRVHARARPLAWSAPGKGGQDRPGPRLEGRPSVGRSCRRRAAHPRPVRRPYRTRRGPGPDRRSTFPTGPPIRYVRASCDAAWSSRPRRSWPPSPWPACRLRRDPEPRPRPGPCRRRPSPRSRPRDRPGSRSPRLARRRLRPRATCGEALFVEPGRTPKAPPTARASPSRRPRRVRLEAAPLLGLGRGDVLRQRHHRDAPAARDARPDLRRRRLHRADGHGLRAAAADRIVDLYRPDFFRICGCASWSGTVRVTVSVY